MDASTLKCLYCEESLPFTEIPMILLSCGDCVCNNHYQEPLCRTHASVCGLCNIKDDPVSNYYCEQVKAISTLGASHPSDSLMLVYQQMIPALRQRVQELLGSYSAATTHQEQGVQEQVPQGQFSQGQVPQEQPTQGQIPQGPVSQEQYYPEQAAQEQLPQEQFPQGQVPEEQIPQGQIPKEKVTQAEPVPEEKWMCAFCQFRNILENAICWQCKAPRDADTSQCMQAANSYYSYRSDAMDCTQLTTVSDIERSSTWKCPQGCRTEIPMTESRCSCGYVNLNLVQSTGFGVAVPPTEPKATQQSEKASEIQNPCWTCAYCNYEYNMKDADVCSNCMTANPEHSAYPQQSGKWASNPQTDTTEEKKVSAQAIDPYAPVWPCANCGYEYNGKDSPFCLRCQAKSPLKQKEEEDKQASSIWTCKKCYRQQTGVPLETCDLCQVSSGIQTDVKQAVKQGYWSCVPCGTHYNQIGYQCNRCGRSQDHIPEIQSVPTWKCPNCQTDHPNTLTQCNRCHPSGTSPPQSVLSSSHSSTEVLLQEEKRTDANTWTCTRCKQQVDLTLSKCDKCGDRKPISLMCSRCHKALIEVNDLCRACANARNTVELKKRIGSLRC